MRPLELREFERSEPLRLSVAERDALSEFVTITSVAGQADAYYLTPGSRVGAFELGDLLVSIRPKLDISRVLFLASYAIGAFELQERHFPFSEAETLVEALVPAFVSSAKRAFGRGLLHGYRTQEEPLHTVRGRIVVSEQIRRRFDIPFPVEVRYDEFTDDILANRLVKAAAALLGDMHIQDAHLRDGLRWTNTLLGRVSPVHFSPRDLPSVPFDRLNEHYREVVELSRLILRYRAFELDRGDVRANGFLVDMNEVFQDFVTRALRETLRISNRTFRSDEALPKGLTLDVKQRVRLKPDLSWWDASVCTFVGDAKYKDIYDEGAPNADLYQVLAYATALDLPGGLLIYAQGEADPVVHQIRHSGKRLEVATVNLSGSIDDIRASIGGLAERVRALRRDAARVERAA